MITIPGISFGQCGEGYVRIACTVDIDALEEAFNRYIKIDRAAISTVNGVDIAARSL